MISLNTLLCDRRSALIVVDVQDTFCHPDGPFAKKGLDLSMVDNVIPKIQVLVDEAHKKNIPVIFIKNTEDENTDCEAWLCRPDGDENSPNEGVTRRGEWGTEIYKLVPEKKDIVLEKHRFSAFHNTRLETVLKANKIETVVVCGLTTNVCVYATACGAVMYGYHVVVPEDAVGAWIKEAHDWALNNIRLFIGKVTSTDNVTDEWSKIK